uniref:Uncharacterized protein n=1 Tax=Setaria viridis TaxID=4556 RepID=A0A4U6VTI3_SETVI|nr:hypothetical protein SEVIR_2G217950v2 [Setaria viridis]
MAGRRQLRRSMSTSCQVLHSAPVLQSFFFLSGCNGDKPATPGAVAGGNDGGGPVLDLEGGGGGVRMQSCCEINPFEAGVGCCGKKSRVA